MMNLLTSDSIFSRNFNFSLCDNDLFSNKYFVKSKPINILY